jgi:SAM-dependent methyltransferase
LILSSIGRGRRDADNGEPRRDLTSSEDWNDYWRSIDLPAEARIDPSEPLNNAILEALLKYLPHDSGLSAAELGGSPGQYLAFLHRQLGYRITSIDYSDVGCQKTSENFHLLGIPGTVVEADIFDDGIQLPTFDVVYSLGLIEHFAALTPVVARHVRLLASPGYLVLGVPNLRGVQGFFMKRIAPRTYASHEISTMDLKGWTQFERTLDLEVIFKGYIGGFEPRIFRRRPEAGGAIAWLLAVVAVAINWAWHGPLRFLPEVNGPRASGYAIAVYRRG